jgi:hypothetical protein
MSCQTEEINQAKRRGNEKCSWPACVNVVFATMVNETPADQHGSDSELGFAATGTFSL